MGILVLQFMTSLKYIATDSTMKVSMLTSTILYQTCFCVQLWKLLQSHYNSLHLKKQLQKQTLYIWTD